jgi:hypothetical protein
MMEQRKGRREQWRKKKMRREASKVRRLLKTNGAGRMFLWERFRC